MAGAPTRGAACGREACAIVLTGIGDDGAIGLRSVQKVGGHTIAQDRSTSLIYGMPRWAVEMGAATVELPLDRIAAEIIRACGTR